MTNRLRNFLRATPFCVGLCLFILPTAWLQAQPNFFNFSYNGPTTLSVGPTCSSMLQGNVPDPVVTSPMGFNITVSMFDPVASMFQYSDLFSSGTVAHVYWYVEDDAGHSHTFEYFINFVDSTPPAFNLTGVFDTLEFSSIVQVPGQMALPVTDNCTMVVSDTFYQTVTPDTCESGTFTRTWMATDANSNTAVFTQTIIIYPDTLPPQITGYPVNGSSTCEQLATAYPAWRDLQIATFAATDASGIKSMINNAPSVFPPGCKVPLTVKFWAIDNCNIQQIVTVVFSTSDTQGPVVVIPPKDTVAYCSQSDNEFVKLRQWIKTRAYSQALDNCSPPLTYSMKIGANTVDSAQVEAAFLASFANGCVTDTVGNQIYNKVHGFVSVNFYVRDACGNETLMGNADFGAIDTLPPIISGINTSEQCGGGNDQTALQSWINAHGNATVIDDCSGFTWTNFSFTSSSGQSGNGNFNSGPYPSVQANNCTWFTDVTFRATDDCGNSSTITLRWSIVDTQVPTFTGLQPNITVYCPNTLPTIPAATVSDNCDANVAITFSRVYMDSLCDGSYTVLTTWTATDDCGNSASAMQNIFVSDTTRPVFTLVPANQTFRCDTFVLPPVPIMGVNITANDVCSPVVSITTATVSLQDPNPDTCGHYTYDIIRTFTATDECGNTQTATQRISVIDNLGPVPGGILDTTALCSSLLPFPAPLPIATDACSGLTAAPTSIGQTNMPGPCTDQYTITVHWTASDVCGNKTNFNQLVHVIDTVAPTLVNIPPNITVECNAIPVPPNTSIFNAADNCNDPVTIALVETEIRNPDPTTCEHWTDYIVQREWTATDNCGNAKTYTQLIQIEDTTPPAIVPPGAMMFPTDLGECGADVTVPTPLAVTDICSNQNFAVVLRDTVALVTTIGPGVDSVFFQWTSPNLPPMQPVIGNAVLTIFIDEADAEGIEEYFRVFGENGYQPVPGITNSTPVQCSSSVSIFIISAALMNNWLSDGDLTITLATNNNMGNTINLAACSGSLNRVRAMVTYSYASSDVPIDLSYTLDGGPSQSFPPSGPAFLSSGTHSVVYTATDCVGNSATSSLQITVNDAEPPSLLAPANITAYTGQNNCAGTVTLPFPAITENCMMSASLSLSSAVWPLHFVNHPDAGLVADNISIPLTGLIPNAVGTGILTIRHKGDNAQIGEFFQIFDEGANDLGPTGQGTVLGECSTFFDTIIPVTAAQINAWAAGTGNALFHLVTNTQPGFPDYIGNCAPLLPNGTDGVSQVQVTLEYSYAVVDYAVKKPVNQTVASGTLTGNMTSVTLPPANYTVMYTATDNSGLTGMTSFNVTVRDTVKPKAICQPTFIIQVNPSGAAPFVLSPLSINNGSFDNCTPTANLSYSVSPDSFNCSLAGSAVNTTLTVTDSSGNFATCKTIIGVTTTPPNPYYIPVCENYTLQLFANPPSAAPFSYEWDGPNMYFSDTINPEVTTNAMAIHNGTYCVTITGATGCTSFSCEVVELAILAVTPTLSSNNGFSFCPGQSVVLQTGSYNGQFVSYQWLMDTPSGLVEMGVTTNVTTFTVSGLAPGMYTFYLKVFANGCNTALSNPIIVTMHPTPPANAEPEMTLICEGGVILLNSPTPPTGGLTYEWTGPNGFYSQLQNPSAINPAVKSMHEGIYILVTQQNGCFSNPDTVVVNITAKPLKPTISGEVQVCAGQTIKLVCTNIFTASQWGWTSPTGTTYFTGSNMFEIPNASAVNEGNWRVFVEVDDCPSDDSNPIFVEVQEYPTVWADSNAPICQDSLLKLTAMFSSIDPIFSWLWTGPNGFVKSEQNPTQPNGATGPYIVIAETSFGCAGTDTVNVTNVMPPSIISIGNNAPVCCVGGTTAITLSAIVVPTPHSYCWTGPAFGMTTSTLENPVIGPNGNCTSLNGPYTLIVKDINGCASAPSTTGVNMQEMPEIPVLLVSPQPVCAGATVTLTFSNSTQDTTFVWDRPNGLSDTITNTTTLTIPNAQPWHSGNYTVRIISANGTCQSVPSNTVTVTVFAIPPTPTISSDSPVCEGGTLSFTASDVPGAMYMWSGPAGFNPTTQNPQIQNVTLNMAGVYTLKVTKDICTSPETSVTVDVEPRPLRPTISIPPKEICIDRPPVGEFLNVLNPVNGMLYTWEDVATGMVLAGPSTASQLNLDSVLWLGEGTHNFIVYASSPLLSDCHSPPSLPVSVKFDIIPSNVNAFAGLDRFACVDNVISLNASQPAGAVTGIWSQIGGPLVTIVNPTQPNTTFVGTDTVVYTFQWSLNNGACTNFSRDTVVITAQYPEDANGGPDIYACETTGIQLQATPGITAQGMWTQSLQQQNNLGIVIDDPTAPNTTISGAIEKGMNYAFTWEIGNIGCGVNSANVKVFIYKGKPSAGPNKFVCSNDNCVDLSATQLEYFETGKWTSIPPGISFTSPTSPNTKACGLQPGKNVFVWTTNKDTCGLNSRDTVEVFYEIFPTADNDAVTVPFGSAAQFNVLSNDILPNNFTVVITSPPLSGAIIDEPSTGVYVYRPTSGFTGTDVMTYRVCNTNCPDACSFANVTFQVGGAPDCFIPTIITPNDDGFNDQFKIPLECTIGEGGAELDVTIFNQWGDAVFHAKPYQNDWSGTYNNEELPAGTYYFVVKLNDKDKPTTGFLLIQR